MQTAPSRNAIDWRRLARLAPRAAAGGLLLGWALTVAFDPPPQATEPASGTTSGTSAETSSHTSEAASEGTSRGTSHGTSHGTSRGTSHGTSWGGDFPAFLTAGRIVRAGLAEQLYDIPTQQRFERGMPTEGTLTFYYPPFVAAAYAPLAGFDYRTAYAIFTLVALTALAAAVGLLVPLSATIRHDPVRAFALALLFYPVLRSTFGGQNTAISMFLVAATWRLLHARRDLAAGIVLGMLSYKPQFLVPVAGVLLLAGRPHATFGVAISAAALAAAGVAMMGWDWPVQWWNAASHLSTLDREVNHQNSISFSEFASLVGMPGAGLVLSALLSLVVAWIGWKRGREDPDGVFVLVVAASLLIAPHALYYDVGLALPAIALLADRGHAAAAIALWLGAASQLVLPDAAASPVAIVVVALVVLLVREIQSSAATSRSRRASSSSLSVE